MGKTGIAFTPRASVTGGGFVLLLDVAGVAEGFSKLRGGGAGATESDDGGGFATGGVALGGGFGSESTGGGGISWDLPRAALPAPPD